MVTLGKVEESFSKLDLCVVKRLFKSKINKINNK